MVAEELCHAVTVEEVHRRKQVVGRAHPPVALHAIIVFVAFDLLENVGTHDIGQIARRDRVEACLESMLQEGLLEDLVLVAHELPKRQVVVLTELILVPHFDNGARVGPVHVADATVRKLVDEGEVAPTAVSERVLVLDASCLLFEPGILHPDGNVLHH